MNSESSGRPKRRVHRLLVLMRRRRGQPSHARRPTDGCSCFKGRAGKPPSPRHQRTWNHFRRSAKSFRIYEVCENVTFHPRPHMLWTMPSTHRGPNSTHSSIPPAEQFSLDFFRLERRRAISLGLHAANICTTHPKERPIDRLIVLRRPTDVLIRSKQLRPSIF